MVPSAFGGRSFALYLSGSYVLAIATAIVASVTWVEGHVWVAAVLFTAWVALMCWAFPKFGARSLWALLGVLVLNPLTIFFGGLNYACAVNSACL